MLLPSAMVTLRWSFKGTSRPVIFSSTSSDVCGNRPHVTGQQPGSAHLCWREEESRMKMSASISVPLTGHQHELEVCSASLQQQQPTRTFMGGLRILFLKLTFCYTGQHLCSNTEPSEPGRSDEPRRGESGCYPEEHGSSVAQQRWNSSAQKVNLTSELIDDKQNKRGDLFRRTGRLSP